MSEKPAPRFSDTLRTVDAALAKDKEAAKQARAAAAAALPKFSKAGDVSELGAFADALPKGLGGDFLGALAQEISLRGRDWARVNLGTCLRTTIKALAELGADA